MARDASRGHAAARAALREIIAKAEEALTELEALDMYATDALEAARETSRESERT